MISHCPEGFTTGSGSWRSSLWAFQPNLWPQAPAAYAYLSLNKAGQLLAGCPAREVLTISFPRSWRPRDLSLPIFGVIQMTSGCFWVSPAFLNQHSNPLGKGQTCLSVRADSGVPGQLPSWDIPGLLWEASLCLHNLTFPPQQRAEG